MTCLALFAPVPLASCGLCELPHGHGAAPSLAPLPLSQVFRCVQVYSRGACSAQREHVRSEGEASSEDAWVHGKRRCNGRPERAGGAGLQRGSWA